MVITISSQRLLDPFRSKDERRSTDSKWVLAKMQVAVDSKRLDKLLKRLKPLFEEKLKIKQRLKGLQSFLGKAFRLISSLNDKSGVSGTG